MVTGKGVKREEEEMPVQRDVEALGSNKQPWEPMRLVAVGTVAALLESSTGSRNDGAGMTPNMMVGV